MKASSVVRESVRTVLHRPALIVLEIAWRWNFGLLSLLFVGGAASWFFHHTPVVERDLRTLHGLDLQLAQLAVQDILLQAGDRIFHLLILLVVGIGILWTIFAGAGRTLTLRMILARPVRFLPVCAAQLLRVVITIACLVFFVLWMWFAARLSVPDPEAPPHWKLYFLLTGTEAK